MVVNTHIKAEAEGSLVQDYSEINSEIMSWLKQQQQQKEE